MTEQFKYLFSPIKIGPVTLKNRIVFPPHVTNLSENGILSERMGLYHAERAKGGAGLIIIEGTLAGDEPEVFMTEANTFAHDDRCIPGFQRVADMVHEHGTKIFCQLYLLGIWAGRGASAMPNMWTRISAREATVEEIEEYVKSYGVSARNLRDAGIDGVELHATHGALINQFLSPLCNKRTDKYGGSFENRMTFLLEILDQVREEVDDDLAVGVRLIMDEMMPGGITLDEGKQIAEELEATGQVDYLSVDAAIEPHQTHIMTAPMYAPAGHMVYSAVAAKEVLEEIPVMAVGRIKDPLLAEKVLAQGQADLIGMCRGQIAAPELAHKALAGRLDDIRHCLGERGGCSGRSSMGVLIGRAVNPSAGKEKALGVYSIQPAKEKKTVLVVGGGVAGMEAARTAATRGHRVILCEKQEDLGGQLPLAASLPGRDELSDIVRWFQAQLPKVGVEIHLGEEISEEKVRELKPDAVIVATGASYLRDGLNAPTFSPIAGWEQEHVTTPEEILSGRQTAGQKVVIVDETGFLVGPGIAEWLADQGKDVELITSDPSVGAMLFATLQLPWLYGRIMGKVTLSPNTAVIQIAGRAIITINPHSGQQGQIEDVDTVVLVTGKLPNDTLYKALKGLFPEVYIAGDCDRAPHAVFGIGEAIGSGHRVGRIV